MSRFNDPMRRIGGVLLLAGLLGGTLPALAKTYALVVGINDYKSEKTLKGAVNDARDIADALRALGVSDVVLLENRKAKRATITATWDRMVAAAREGDVLVFSYAGHGALEDARRPDTPNGKSTVLVLGDFETMAPGSGERLPDDMLDTMFAKAERKEGVLVLFVADACYSGGLLTRGIDGRAEDLPDRSTPPYVIEDDALPPPDPQTPSAGTVHKNRFFFSSSQFDRTTPEVMIDGKPRGALSWAFARALRGEADRGRSGMLTKGALASYVTETVRQRAEWKQTPRIDPPGEDDRVIFTTSSKTSAPATAPPLSIRFLGASASDKNRLLATLHDITAVDAGADLIWDAAKNEVVSSMGDVVAQNVPADPAVMQSVVDKWRLLHWLNGRGAGSGMEITLLPGDQRHPAGTIITLKISGIKQPAFLLFNIAADGTVQKLYPMPGEPATRSVGKPYVVDTRARPPFGADHVVAIASAAPLKDLQHFLDAHDGQPATAELRRILGDTLDGSVQMAVHGLYTGP